MLATWAGVQIGIYSRYVEARVLSQILKRQETSNTQLDRVGVQECLQ